MALYTHMNHFTTETQVPAEYQGCHLDNEYAECTPEAREILIMVTRLIISQAKNKCYEIICETESIFETENISMKGTHIIKLCVTQFICPRRMYWS